MTLKFDDITRSAGNLGHEIYGRGYDKVVRDIDARQALAVQRLNAEGDRIPRYAQGKYKTSDDDKAVLQATPESTMERLAKINAMNAQQEEENAFQYFMNKANLIDPESSVLLM